jgi:hypothetical protein
MSRAWFLFAFFGVALTKTFNAPASIDHFLLTGIEWMAGRTNIQMDLVLCNGGAHFKLMTASAMKSNFMVSGMNIFLHYLFL